jgi:hypothetical protein
VIPATKGQREAGRAEERISPPLADVFLTVAVSTSAGPGPGHKQLPPGEAARPVSDRRAVYGDQPPLGYEDGGTDARDTARMMPR